MALKINEISVKGYENVIHATNETTKLDCIISIHNTKLGPALGGVRSWSYKNFKHLKSNVYNLGLSSANLSKYMLAKKIKQKLKYLKIKIIKNMKDPDQRNYYVSNKKIEKKGFKAKIKIESGIDELINVFNNTKENIINNY